MKVDRQRERHEQQTDIEVVRSEAASDKRKSAKYYCTTKQFTVQRCGFVLHLGFQSSQFDLGNWGFIVFLCKHTVMMWSHAVSSRSYAIKKWKNLLLKSGITMRFLHTFSILWHIDIKKYSHYYLAISAWSPNSLLYSPDLYNAIVRQRYTGKQTLKYTVNLFTVHWCVKPTHAHPSCFYCLNKSKRPIKIF